MRRIVIVTLLSIFAVACGGSDKKTIPLADYIKRTDAVCSKYDKEIAKLPESKTTADQVKVIDQGVKIEKRQLNELRDLPDPATKAKDFAKLYDDLEARFDDLDKKTAAELDAMKEDPMKDLNQRAKDLGFTVCGQS